MTIKEFLNWAGDVDAPTIDIEPNGNYCLEWYKEPNVVSVSISEGGQVYWAAIIDNQGFHGRSATKELREVIRAVQ